MTVASACCYIPMIYTSPSFWGTRVPLPSLMHWMKRIYCSVCRLWRPSAVFMFSAAARAKSPAAHSSCREGAEAATQHLKTVVCGVIPSSGNRTAVTRAEENGPCRATRMLAAGAQGLPQREGGILSLYNPGVFCGSYSHSLHGSRAGHIALCKITCSRAKEPSHFLCIICIRPREPRHINALW